MGYGVDDRVLVSW